MNKTAIPILMYHGIVSNENEIVNPIHISKTNFEEQMAWLSENNYQTISIGKMLQYLHHQEVPPRSLVLTFDDGFQSLFKNATPILEKFGFSATLFLLTGAVGKQTYADFNIKRTVFPESDGPLCWDQLKIMEASCWDVQSHSCNHYTHRIDGELLENEMRTSKEVIESHLQKKVEFYCFPYGSYNTKCLELLKATGYKAAFSVHSGMASPNSDIRRLPRIEINQLTNLKSFRRKVETGYSNSLDRLRSSIIYTLYKNTRITDVIKKIYGRTKDQMKASLFKN